MKHLGPYAAALLLSACGNPGGVSDLNYEKYKELGAPKILYSCNKGETPAYDFEAASECLKLKDDPSKLSACMKKSHRDAKLIIEVGYAAGIGVAVTYNKLLSDTKARCNGEFKVLESKS